MLSAFKDLKASAWPSDTYEGKSLGNAIGEGVGK